MARLAFMHGRAVSYLTDLDVSALAIYRWEVNVIQGHEPT